MCLKIKKTLQDTVVTQISLLSKDFYYICRAKGNKTYHYKQNGGFMNYKFLLAVVAMCALLVGSCDKLGKDETVVNAVPEQFFTLKPTGTISGKVVDRHTEKPVKGAIVSIGFNGAVTKSTTDESGTFSFANVPGNRDASTGIVTGTYQLTVSLVEVNKTIPDSLPKYREYYYNSSLSVTFIDLKDCDSCKNKVPVEGLEANIWFNVAKLNTTINGSVVDKNYDPVPNATVWLREMATGDVLQQTTTDATGNYTFTKVEDGTSVFVHAKSSDGTLEGAGAAMTLTINRTLENLRQQVTAERVVITAADDVNPYIVSITPENLADVNPSGLTVVYRFSEPIKQTAYTVTNAPLGLGTLIDDIQFNFAGLKKSTAGNTNFTIAWDAAFTTLTVMPVGIVGSAKYQVNISAALPKLEDLAGNIVVANPYGIVGDDENLNFTTNGASTVPVKPVVTRRLNSAVGFGPLNFDGGTVRLEWNLDGNARSYRVYRSIDNEQFQLISDNVLSIQYDDNPGPLVSGYNPPANPNPFKAFTVKYKVTGVSKDLVEGPESEIIEVKDDTKPRMAGAVVDSATSTEVDYLFLQFDEPLTISTAQTAANFSVTNSGGGLGTTISEAVYLGYSNVLTSYLVQLTITKHSIDAGDVVLTGTSIIDLAGNPVDNNNNSVTF